MLSDAKQELELEQEKGLDEEHPEYVPIVLQVNFDEAASILAILEYTIKLRVEVTFPALFETVTEFVELAVADGVPVILPVVKLNDNRRESGRSECIF